MRGFDDDDSIEKNPFLNGKQDTPSNYFEIEDKAEALLNHELHNQRV